jgi:glycosyltransferase involved in cell wall biosynthesis
MGNEKIDLAVIGIRGIPVVYSGFETFAENLSTRLVKRNFNVTVYCRPNYVKRTKYKGVNLHTIPTIKTKNLETFIHSFLSTFHACFILKPDTIYYLGVGSSLFAIFPKLFGIKTMINIDGLDWKREKWGFLARKYLKLSEYLASALADQIISDSWFIKKYFENKYKRKTIYIPYGFDPNLLKIRPQQNQLQQYNLKKDKYFVWVGRLVPDNHLDELVRAYKKTKTDYKCVIIGDNPYSQQYKKHIKKLTGQDPRFVFTGFLDRPAYAQLVRNSFAYVETKRSGGTHPSLIEAMGFNCQIISNKHQANQKILKDSAYYYSPRKLSQTMKTVLKSSEKKSPKQIVKKKYLWKRILKKYVKLLTK